MRPFLILAVTLFFFSTVNGQSINSKKVAVHGYDIVAYHTVQQALQGSDKLSAKHGEVYYHFSSLENLNLFKGNPEKYLPKYGGYCAIGLAIYDGKYDIDPEDFLIDEGELYLFCPGEIGNWIADQERLKKLADIEWVKRKEDPKN